jgi:hypothetical protein
MDKLKVVSKGYTITCESWENDNYRAKSVVTESKDLAVALYKMCDNLFSSENNKKSYSIGNSCDLDRSTKRKITNFFKQNPILLNEKQCSELKEIDEEEYDIDDFYANLCAEWIYKLLGGSEYYFCRVAESTTVTYSPEDIYVERIL